LLRRNNLNTYARIPYAKLTAAVDQALEMGCADVAAIRHLLMSDQLRHSVGEAIEIGSLSAYDRPTGSTAVISRA